MKDDDPQNARVLLDVRTTRVCIARSREVYYFSLAADALHHIFAYPPSSPPLSRHDLDQHSQQVLVFCIEDDTIRYFLILIIISVIFYWK